MASKLDSVVVTFIFLASISVNQCQKTDLKYRAIWELVEKPVKGTPVQVFFEENYSSELQMFSLNVKGTDVKSRLPYSNHYLEYQNLKQSFIYTNGNKDCAKDNGRKWSKDPQSRVVRDGLNIYSLLELLTLDDSKFAKEKVQDRKETVRGIDAKVRSYSFEDNDVSASVDIFWSDNFTTTSMTELGKPVPLGAKIEKKSKTDSSVVTQFIAVLMFTHQEIDLKTIEPIRGTYCEGLGTAGLFPSVSMPGFGYQSEFLLEDYLTAATVDAWMDPVNKIYRADFIPITSFNIPKTQTVKKIISLNQKAVYSTEGSVASFNNLEDLYPDPQLLFDPRQPEQWDLKHWFGVSNTTYYRIGETLERGFPCMLYHGLRYDWPTEEIKSGAQIKTLWEWCIADQLVNKKGDYLESRFPLISLNIYVVSGPKDDSKFYKQGVRLTFSFHKAKDLNPILMNTVYFDIGNAFSDENKKNMQFKINVPKEDLGDFNKLMSDPHLHAEIRTSIFTAAGLTPSSLRVSNVRIHYANDGKNIESDTEKLVLFTLLGNHPNLSVEVEPINLQKSISNLGSAIDGDKLQVSFDASADPKNPKILKFSAKARSLEERYNIATQPYSQPSSSGYGSGTMAAVAIVMLLLGLSMGAGGFFAKRRYFDRNQ